MRNLTLFRILLLAASSAGIASADLTLLPTPDITGTPGSTIGWGYTITNTSSDWLETTGLTAPSFPFGTPVAIFDYPVVAPNSSVTETFSTTTLNNGCTLLPCGIYEITLPVTLPSNPTISGSFDVTTELFDSDPLTNLNASDLGAGPTLSADFQVSEIPGSPVPEPREYGLLLAFGLALIALRLQRADRPRTQL